MKNEKSKIKTVTVYGVVRGDECEKTFRIRLFDEETQQAKDKEDIEKEAVTKFCQNFYGKSASFFFSTGVSVGKGNFYGQVVKPCKTGGYDCLTRSIVLETEIL